MKEILKTTEGNVLYRSTSGKYIIDSNESAADIIAALLNDIREGNDTHSMYATKTIVSMLLNGIEVIVIN